ncbi:MAG: prepilin-type N-terminal cleavage/methylation domain-containing protein [Patescibacteria group bacterium]
MKKGFTLIELLIVIAIIAILAAVVFVALDPLTRFRQARNSTRWSDITAVLDAVKVHQVDNSGSYLASVTALTAGNYYTIGTCATGGDDGCTAKTTQAACVDLTGLVTAGYLGKVPMDPSTGTAAETDYYLMKSSAGAITVGACDPEGSGVVIEIVR